MGSVVTMSNSYKEFSNKYIDEKATSKLINDICTGSAIASDKLNYMTRMLVAQYEQQVAPIFSHRLVITRDSLLSMINHLQDFYSEFSQSLVALISASEAINDEATQDMMNVYFTRVLQDFEYVCKRIHVYNAGHYAKTNLRYLESALLLNYQYKTTKYTDLAFETLLVDLLEQLDNSVNGEYQIINFHSA